MSSNLSLHSVLDTLQSCFSSACLTLSTKMPLLNMLHSIFKDFSPHHVCKYLWSCPSSTYWTVSSICPSSACFAVSSNIFLLSMLTASLKMSLLSRLDSFFQKYLPIAYYLYSIHVYPVIFKNVPPWEVNRGLLWRYWPTSLPTTMGSTNGSQMENRREATNFRPLEVSSRPDRRLGCCKTTVGQ